jgi:hypothetical protein
VNELVVAGFKAMFEWQLTNSLRILTGSDMGFALHIDFQLTNIIRHVAAPASIKHDSKHFCVAERHGYLSWQRNKRAIRNFYANKLAVETCSRIYFDFFRLLHNKSREKKLTRNENQQPANEKSFHDLIVVLLCFHKQPAMRCVSKDVLIELWRFQISSPVLLRSNSRATKKWWTRSRAELAVVVEGKR